MSTSPDPGAQLMIRAGLSLWLLAAAALFWEGLALQSPDSPYHLGTLAGPVAQLRHGSFALGTGLLAGGWLLPWLFPAGSRAWVALCLTGAAGHVALLLYCAGAGVVGVQLLDPRPHAALVVLLRGAAHMVTVAALLIAVVRAWTGRA